MYYLKQFKIIYPLITFLLIFFDGSLYGNFSYLFSNDLFTILPNITLIWFFFAIQFNQIKNMNFWIWVGLAGVLFDIYFTATLGVYFLAYSLSSFFIFKMQQYFNFKDSKVSLILLPFAYLLFYLTVFFSGILEGSVVPNLFFFLLNTVIPTIIFNTLISSLMFYPTLSLFFNLKK